MRRPTPFLVIAALLLGAASASHAANPMPLATPGLFETIDVVGLGHWQSTIDPLAAASLGQRLSDAPFALPTLLRVGVGRSIELRTETDVPPLHETAFESATDSMRRLHGFTDVSFGAKWRVRGGDAGWLPGVAWLANVETTTGSPAFRGNDFRPSLRATAEWALPHDLTLGLMPGVFRDRDDNGKHYAAGVLALSLGKAWTPRLNTFVELAGERVSQPQRSGAEANIDTGVAFQATQSLQVAAVVSRGFMNTAQASRGGLSISSRF